MKKDKALNYKLQALKYFNDGEELLKKEDFRQASEKLWGAAASFVKAVAEANGLTHNGHAQLFKIVDILSKKTGDEEIRRLFQVANTQHTNFYENWLTPDDVIQGRKDVKKLVRKLEKLL